MPRNGRSRRAVGFQLGPAVGLSWTERTSDDPLDGPGAPGGLGSNVRVGRLLRADHGDLRRAQVAQASLQVVEPLRGGRQGLSGERQLIAHFLLETVRDH